MFYSISASTRSLLNCCGIRFENFRQTIHSVSPMLSHGRILFPTHSLAPMDPMFPRAIGSAYRRRQLCGIRRTIHARRRLSPSVSPPTWPPRAGRTRRPTPLMPNTRTRPTNSRCGASANMSSQPLPHCLAKRLLFTSSYPPQSSSIHSALHIKLIQFMWDQYKALLRLHRAQTRCGGDFAKLRPQARAREWRRQERNLLHLRFPPHSQGLYINAEEII